MNSVGKYLQSQDGKVISIALLIVVFSAAWGYIRGREKALKSCIDPYDFSDLPNGGTGLNEKKDSTGNVIKPKFTVEMARPYAKRAYAIWDTYNPVGGAGSSALSRELLALNDDELVLVCRVYLDAYSETIHQSIVDDYWGLIDAMNGMFDNDEFKLTERLKRLKQE